MLAKLPCRAYLLSNKSLSRITQFPYLETTTTKNTSHQMLEKPNLLKNLTDGCQVSGVNNEIDENTSPQNESKSVLPNSDIKNVVLTNDTPNEVLEGEACVVLNTNSNQS